MAVNPTKWGRGEAHPLPIRKRTRIARHALLAAPIAATIALLARAATAQVSGTWTANNPTDDRRWSSSSAWTSAPLYPDGGGDATFGPDATGFSVDSAGPLRLNVNVTLSRISIDNAQGFWISGRTGSNRVTLTGATTLYSGPYSIPPNYFNAFGVGPQLDFTLASTTGLTKTGPGTLNVNFSDPTVADPAAQPLKGDIRITEGALLVIAGQAFNPKLANPLGDPANRILLDGGTTGVAALSNGDWTIAHPIVVGPAGGGLQSYTASNLTITAPVTGTGALQTADENGKFGSGNRITFAASNPLSGPLVHASRNTLALTGDGAFTAIPSLTLYRNAVLEYADPTPNRLPDAAPVRMGGDALLSLATTSASPVEERVGPLELVGGAARIDFVTSATARAVVLHPASFDRPGRGILSIPDSVGRSTSGARLMFDTAPAMVGSGTAGTAAVGIVPGAFTSGSSVANYTPATYSQTTGLRALTATEYASTFATSGAPQNVKLTAPTTLAGPRTVNSLTLQLTGGYGPALSGTNTITVNSGVVLATVPWTVEPALDFAGREAIFRVLDDLTLTGKLSNANGLTVASGSHTLRLSAASTFTGPVTVNAGNLAVTGSVLKNTPGPLGASAEPLHFTGVGSLLYLDPGATFARDLDVRPAPNGYVTLATPGGATSTAAVNFTGNVAGVGTFAAEGPIDFSGTLSGTFKLSLASGPVRLRATNTFTGGIDVAQGGILAPENANTLSTGRIVFNGPQASLLADRNPLTIPNDVTVVSSMSVLGDQPVDFPGRVSLLAGVLLRPGLSCDAPVTLSGAITGSGLTKSGRGTLRVTGSHRLGYVEVTGGTLELSRPVPAMTASLSGSGVLKFAPGGSRAVNLTLVGLTDTSALDLTDNAIVTGGDAHAYAPFLRSAYHGGLWDGQGIRSSTAAADPELYGIGFARAGDVLDFSTSTSQTFLGATTTAALTLMRTTILGDANLDGVVNFDDLLSLAKHYGGTSTTRIWSDGDFNYDGSVNFDDLLLLAKHYSRALPTTVPNAPSSFGSDLAAAAAAVAVPEPGLSTLAALSLLPLVSRRRRRSTLR